MPQVQYDRQDLTVTITRAGEEVRLEIAEGVQARIKLGDAFRARAEAELWHLFGRLHYSAFLSKQGIVERSPAVRRVVLEIADAELAGIDWETRLELAVRFNQPLVIVRSCPVRPRFLNLPLTLPLRILQMHPSPERKLSVWIRDLFGELPASSVNKAVLVRAAKGYAAPAAWPRVDVLHIDGAFEFDVKRALSMGWPEQPGTLGWFVRSTDRWQTRLVLLDAASDADLEIALRLARALCDKAGPAVVVVSSARENLGTETFYQGFYDLLIHDNPLDQILKSVRVPGVTARLFGGAGREDGVRISNVGSAMADFASVLATPDHPLFKEHKEALRRIAGGAGKKAPPNFTTKFRKRLSKVPEQWKTLAFSMHESEGLVPLGQNLADLRSITTQPSRHHHATGKAVPRRSRNRTLTGGPGEGGPSRIFGELLGDYGDTGGGAPPNPAPSPEILEQIVDYGAGRGDAGGAAAPPTGESVRRMPVSRRSSETAKAHPRFVNSSLWSDAEGPLDLIEQTGAALQTGTVYHLAIQIGPKDVRVRTVHAEALFEEVFKWSPRKKGVWVEIGVTGIDFEVLGDPVQELWLPRVDDSEQVFFAVRPSRAGVSTLRFALYYNHNLIHSFRLAAFTGAGERAAALAMALSVSLSVVGNAGYLARLEYSRTSALDRLERKSERVLSISANELDGKCVLTSKAEDLFDVQVYPDSEMSKIVTQIRKTLDELSYDRPAGVQPQYRFGPYAPDLDRRLEDALVKLASAGFRLYTSLAPNQKTKDALDRRLNGERKIIQIAQLLRNKVIPWAFVYDRDYDEKTKRIGGKEVKQGVCTAAIPAPGGDFSAANCGEHHDCLLNRDRQAERQTQGAPLYHESTVACPLRFWGFRHVLEIPPQQVEDGSYGGREESACIVPKNKLQFAAGLNGTLGTCAQHWADLCTIRAWEDPQYDRDRIIDSLRNPELDFVYFFCHARGGEADEGIDPPYLEFQPAETERLRPQDFSSKVTWGHGPLIFLNACGTLAYSPDALSPFLKALVDGRGAAGILGTEVPVAEYLAGEVAHEFIARFMKGGKAGETLLNVRRELLARKNPLGLVYTLFAPAELMIEQDGDGECR